LKHREFPENPFLMTFSKIAMINIVIMLVAIALGIWQESWLWYALLAGVLLSIVVFIYLNKQCLRQLSCPKCKRHVVFEAGEGFVCKNCRVGWEIG